MEEERKMFRIILKYLKGSLHDRLVEKPQQGRVLDHLKHRILFLSLLVWTYHFHTERFKLGHNLKSSWTLWSVSCSFGERKSLDLSLETKQIL